MYVNDIILFSKSTKKDAETIFEILEKYSLWSGQLVNRSKLGIFFSKHTQRSTQRSIKNILHIKALKRDTTYLGAPLFLTRAPTKNIAYLQSKLEANLAKWRSKCLSWVGRRTLITSVAQTIPIYAMSSFNIPNKVCNNLDSFIGRFWWKPKNQEGSFLIGDLGTYSISQKSKEVLASKKLRK